VWRSHYYERQIRKSGKSDARQKAFKRAADELQARGIIGLSEDWIWIVEPPDKPDNTDAF
jgi:hypothetical protein